MVSPSFAVSPTHQQCAANLLTIAELVRKRRQGRNQISRLAGIETPTF